MKEDVLVSSLAKKAAASSKKKSAPDDEEGLRWRLEHLESQMQKLSDRGYRTRLGENARRAVLRLSPPAVTLELVLLYRDLLAAAVAERTTAGAVRAAAAEPGLRPAPSESAGPAPRR